MEWHHGASDTPGPLPHYSRAPKKYQQMRRKRSEALFREYVDRHRCTPLSQVPLEELREKTEEVDKKPKDEDSCSTSRATTAKSLVRPVALNGTDHRIINK